MKLVRQRDPRHSAIRLWVPPEAAASAKADGRDPIGLDGASTS